jgi:hypothetical protein
MYWFIIASHEPDRQLQITLDVSFRLTHFIKFPTPSSLLPASFTPSPPEPDIGLWEGSPASGRQAVPPRVG